MGPPNAFSASSVFLYRTHLKPLVAERSKGGRVSWLRIGFSALSAHDPPRMERLPFASFQHHSRTFPTTSKIPKEFTAPETPTGCVCVPSRLLSGTRKRRSLETVSRFDAYSQCA